LFSLQLEGESQKVVYSDGRISGERMDGAPTNRIVEPDLKRLLRSTLIHGFFLENQARAVRISPAVKMGGFTCTVLSLDQDGESWKIWIDLDRFFIRKKRLLLPPGDPLSGSSGPVSVEWFFSDFQPMNQRWVAQTFQIFRNGNSFQEGKVTRFSLNEGLPDEAFLP
jgi:hypothetical protein